MTSTTTSVRHLDIDIGYGLITKSNFQTQLHSHYAIEAIFCREGFFDIQTKHTNYINVKSVLIPSKVLHSLRCYRFECDLLFINPMTLLGQLITEQYRLSNRKEAVIHPTHVECWFDRNFLVASPEIQLFGEIQHRKIDPRIRSCVEAIRTSSSVSDLTIKELSSISCLSESRFSHLFKEQTGLSAHQYILWEKICLAVSKAMAGQSLTASAQHAGFFDSAHFHRVFSNMFGVNPFLALKN